MQPRLSLAFFAARAQYWVIFNFISIRTLRSSSAKLHILLFIEHLFSGGGEGGVCFFFFFTGRQLRGTAKSKYFFQGFIQKGQKKKIVCMRMNERKKLIYWSQRPLKLCLPAVCAQAAVPSWGSEFRNNWVLIRPDDSQGHQILEHLYHHIIPFANAIHLLYRNETDRIIGNNKDAEWLLPCSLSDWWISTTATYSSTRPRGGQILSFSPKCYIGFCCLAVMQLNKDYPLKVSVLFLND